MLPLGEGASASFPPSMLPLGEGASASFPPSLLPLGEGASALFPPSMLPLTEDMLSPLPLSMLPLGGIILSSIPPPTFLSATTVISNALLLSSIYPLSGIKFIVTLSDELDVLYALPPTVDSTYTPVSLSVSAAYVTLTVTSRPGIVNTYWLASLLLPRTSTPSTAISSSLYPLCAATVTVTSSPSAALLLSERKLPPVLLTQLISCVPPVLPVNTASTTTDPFSCKYSSLSNVISLPSSPSYSPLYRSPPTLK